jgi:hypothetical protein
MGRGAPIAETESGDIVMIIGFVGEGAKIAIGFAGAN